MLHRLRSHDLPRSRWLALALVLIVLALAVAPFALPGSKSLNVAAKILIFVVLPLSSALCGISIWFVIVGALRMMAKSAPLLRHVYVRHLRYRHHYLPTSSPWRRF